MYFANLPTGISYCNITYADDPRFYARIYRDMAKPKTWFVVFIRKGNNQVDAKSGFKTMTKAAEFARKHMMEWEGWHDNQA